jgi:transcriptional regulator with XRE-family HTH domain
MYRATVDRNNVSGYGLVWRFDMEWMKWVRMATQVRWETRRERGGAGVAGISRPSMSRYERGDCPHRERVEMWARGLGLDEDVALAAWGTRYESALIAEVRALRSDVVAWQQGRAGRVRGICVQKGRLRDVAVWREGEGYAGQIGGRLPVKAPTLAGVLDVLGAVSA